MNKAQIIAEIETKPFVGKLITVYEASVLPDGTKIYHAEILEIVENACRGKTIAFYVIDEGLPTEEAYYKDFEPIPTIQPFQNKMKPLLKEFNAKILEQGETWALAETNTLINTNGIYSIQKDQYFLVDADPLQITKIG